MDPARWRRLDDLFQRALEHPTDQRLRFLDGACPDDPQMRREVAAMLAADAAEAPPRTSRREEAPQEKDSSSRSPDAPPPIHQDRLADIVRSSADAVGLDEETHRDLHETPEDSAVIVPLPFPSLGPYRLIEELGRGGLSTVYLAERDDTHFAMKVAIKLVRRGFDTPDLLDRLRLERQILARLEHPNIARLIDGGTAPDGRPYFVMERIEGERIDHWCRRHDLDLRRRLELFRKLCDGVQIAHRRLVLHRDIKPSNILVTAAGVPKLLDFGIAKLLGPQGEESLAPGFATLTSTGMRLLTPEFASPEQIRGETLTTASDVYSLGVLLYLLITGEPPYTFDRQRPAEVERIVCESEPPRPSAVVWNREGGSREKPDRSRLGWPRRAHGDDLDTIVAKALRKEPERRYGSVAELAEDLRCYLDALPVSARRDTLGYRTRKFIQRHRIPVLATVALFLVLVAGVVTTSWQARVARKAQVVAEEQRELAERQRAQAERQRRRAEEATAFLVDLFEETDPYRTAGAPITARELFDRGAAHLQEEHAGDPRLRATLLSTAGKVYQNLSLFDESETYLREALDLHRKELGDQAPEVLQIQLDLANLWLDQERFLEADRTLHGIAAWQRRNGDSKALAEVLYARALAQRGLGQEVDAQALLEEVLVLQSRQPDALAIAQTHNALGKLRRSQGDYRGAQEILQGVLTVRRDMLSADHPLIAHTLTDLAITHQQMADLETAEALYREILAMQRRVFGESHHNVVTATYNLVSVLVDQAKVDQALALTDQLDDQVLALYGKDHAAMARALYIRAQAHRVAGDVDTALPYARRALDINTRYFGEEHPTSLRSTYQLVGLLASRGDGVAEATLVELVDDLRRILAPEDRRLPNALISLAALKLRRGDAQRAEPLLWEALSIQRTVLPEDHWQTAQTEGQLGRCLARLGRFDEAEDLLRRSHQKLEARFGTTHAQTKAVSGYLKDLEEQRAGSTEAPLRKPR